MTRRVLARGLTVTVVLALGLAGNRSAAAAAPTAVEYPVPTSNSGTFEVTPGPDGAVWFTEKVGAKIGRITSAGAITEFTIPPPIVGMAAPAVVGITTGPDGALWFAGAAPYAGRMTTAGAVNWVPLSSPSIGVADGPDGNLWFTESDGRIARVSPAGAVTEFPGPPSGHLPALITAGADGALWFSEYADAIGRITTAGVYTEYPLAHPSSNACVAPGPDGNVWIPEQGYLASVSPSGVITEHAAPAVGASGCVTGGKDQSMWFSTAAGIGRMTAGGLVVTFASPSGSSSVFVCLGPDGHIWSSEGNAVARWRDTSRSITSVEELASGFAPASLRASQGSVLRWTAVSGDGLEVVDAAGIVPASAGVTPPGSSVSATLSAASSYTFNDPRHAGRQSLVRVSATVLPGAGSTATSFTVTWASATAMPGTGEDVQVAWCATASCVRTFATWIADSPATQGSFAAGNPDWHGAGTYTFRARLVGSAGAVSEAWSPVTAVTVSP